MDGKTGNLTQLSIVGDKVLEMQTSTCRNSFVVSLFSFVNGPERKTMEEKLNEKRQELHPPQ